MALFVGGVAAPKLVSAAPTPPTTVEACVAEPRVELREIVAALEARYGLASACRRIAEAAGEEPRGAYGVMLTLDAEGDVISARATGASRGLAECLERGLLHVRLARPEGGSATLTYSVTLTLEPLASPTAPPHASAVAPVAVSPKASGRYGCGCEVFGPRRFSPWEPVALGAIAILAAASRRRARRQGSSTLTGRVADVSR